LDKYLSANLIVAATPIKRNSSKNSTYVKL